MSYTPFYPNGWASGETGGTPITPAALNHIEAGIKQTYSDFAPGGYGLGTVSADLGSSKYGNDANNATACGWYGFSSQAANTPFPYGIILTSNRLGAGQVQLSFSSLNDGTHNNTMAIRRKDSPTGNWTAWEYINPPMMLGVEYRTAKRYKGKPVYIKAVACGDAPKSGGKFVAHGISNCMALKCYGTSSGGLTVPYRSDTTGVYIDIAAHSTGFTLYSNYDNSMTGVVGIIEYWKSTD